MYLEKPQRLMIWNGRSIFQSQVNESVTENVTQNRGEISLGRY
jgi:heme-binding NEAT domain protein